MIPDPDVQLLSPMSAHLDLVGQKQIFRHYVLYSGKRHFLLEAEFSHPDSKPQRGSWQNANTDVSTNSRTFYQPFKTECVNEEAPLSPKHTGL